MLIFAQSDSTTTLAVATIIAAGLAAAPAFYAAVKSHRSERRSVDNSKILRYLVKLTIYTQRRNHTIIDGNFRIALMLWAVMNHFNIPESGMPRPREPEPFNWDELDSEVDAIISEL